ncbi:16S rRNA (guanine(966)-N(2))-methyltransferase RsmD [Puniceicoccaceae bacterium K14]|nr:16S rRNA (guanine(966)-N(2))-methyltransferase RsmD [Puniceicoccaceae bacterium K14]
MRISGGKARGVRLSISKSGVHRPAMDKLRQSVFSSLGGVVEDAKVCDLFAGTGSYGLEALSRGATSCTFVENNRQACQMIKTNISIVAKSMAVQSLDTEILPIDVTKWSLENKNFDLVFVDPPYEIIDRVSSRLFQLFDSILTESGIVAFEMPGKLDLTHPNWTLKKRFGKGAHNPTCCLYHRTS